MPRLRRSRPGTAGLHRVASGRGFRFVTAEGKAASEEDRARARALAIPPAWKNVWICPWANGHIQATGEDAAGRLQYIYHPDWVERREQVKYEHVLDFAERLPKLRSWCAEALTGRGLTRDRVTATALRLLDLGLFRIGEDQYDRDSGTRGLATLTGDDVRFKQGRALFSYTAKGGLTRTYEVSDPDVVSVLKALRRRAGRGRLLTYYASGQWHALHSSDINEALRTVVGMEASAKDFRTWHATVLAAVALAVSELAPDSPTARRRAISRAVTEVADYLGNTPAVCRRSYIDHRVIDRYMDGETVSRALDGLGRDSRPGSAATDGPVERAVLRLLRGA